jgi:hypothetical protein
MLRPSLVAMTTFSKNMAAGVPPPMVQSMGLLCKSSDLVGAEGGIVAGSTFVRNVEREILEIAAKL